MLCFTFKGEFNLLILNEIKMAATLNRSLSFCKFLSHSEVSAVPAFTADTFT